MHYQRSWRSTESPANPSLAQLPANSDLCREFYVFRLGFARRARAQRVARVGFFSLRRSEIGKLIREFLVQIRETEITGIDILGPPLQVVLSRGKG
jgi:hypothetical protein